MKNKRKRGAIKRVKWGGIKQETDPQLPCIQLYIFLMFICFLFIYASYVLYMSKQLNDRDRIIIIIERWKAIKAEWQGHPTIRSIMILIVIKRL